MSERTEKCFKGFGVFPRRSAESRANHLETVVSGCCSHGRQGYKLHSSDGDVFPMKQARQAAASMDLSKCPCPAYSVRLVERISELSLRKNYVVTITTRLEAIASRVEAIATRLEAIASRVVTGNYHY